MSKVNFKSLGKSLCVGLMVEVILVQTMTIGVIGGNVSSGPNQKLCGTQTITYVQAGRIQHDEVPVCLKINTQNSRIWKYATCLYHSENYKMEGFEKVSNRLSKLGKVPRIPD